MSIKSGLFNYDAVTRECPVGFTKVTEGTTAVLEPPPKEKAPTQPTKQQQQQQQPPRKRPDHGDEEDANDDATQQVDQAVFYNPAQVVNRDLSISAIELFSRLRLTEPRRRGGTTEGITILEALSATGLRAIRYFKEITNVRYIIANDMDADAVDCIGRNCAYNGVPVQYPTTQENMPASAIEVYTEGAVHAAAPSLPLTSSSASPTPRVGVKSGGAILPNLDDANDLMFRLAMNPNVRPGQRVCLLDVAAEDRGGANTPPLPRPLLQQELMDVVDLDPYGSASPFLEGAFRCIKEGGLMLVTSTDSAILCGNFADTAHAKYSSLPYKAGHCHEAAVRTLLACIERVANKHKKYIVPLVSLHIDFYVRCFFRVYTQPAEVKLSVCKLGYQLQCASCPAFWVRPMATVRQPRPSKQDRRRQKREHNDRQRQAREGCRDTNTTADQTDRNVATVHNVHDGNDDHEDEDHAKGTERPSQHGKEVYPPSPSRQSSPKLTPLTLQQLPPTHPAASSSPSSSSPSLPGASFNTCPVCGGNIILSGPLYAAPTQNREFLEQLLDLFKERAAEGRLNAEARITGLVRTALDELPDCPLFYQLPDVASYARVRCPPTPDVVGALARLGYRCSQVHCAATGLKTDCPPEMLFRVMLQWKVLQDALDGEGHAATLEEPAAPSSSSPSLSAGAARPLRVTPLAEADFTYDKAYDFRGRVIGVAKFVPNAPGWGPRRRHQGAAPQKTKEECEEEVEVEGRGTEGDDDAVSA
ncbi:putative N(2) N(2)-dimethylguanosine tRNA methyltransferase [Leptomonas pyrrhocoris]|uniref:tRNA (guanine(26)-N(2))-dimethyltransferase n=1 Tax=Leptomonas pyrrhocoris TaxID=157538 RepID=A0A0M9FUP0_LEPPY|nr:putative N(2) N(2)-dimethylguanosine tRNA methyltransferase [Leptomonas pyrrhocoris]KPA76450.1 putative N(2) N(2)-dimethylguanosine tRNA methyltransferase [Leptomonas pyrrhocoris]|eukprot:XP_015654889.1 putative N(2) N(2)-dimethylguanosine tRNA methyltransferase [Leptomonas pyrrhocoris]